MVYTSCKTSHNIQCYFHVIIWGLGLFVLISLGEGGLRSFDICEGSNPTEQILPGMGEKMNSMKNKNGLGKNFKIHNSKFKSGGSFTGGRACSSRYKEVCSMIKSFKI